MGGQSQPQRGQNRPNGNGRRKQGNRRKRPQNGVNEKHQINVVWDQPQFNLEVNLKVHKILKLFNMMLQFQDLTTTMFPYFWLILLGTLKNLWLYMEHLKEAKTQTLKIVISCVFKRHF